jgi:hypothetical protein
MNWEEVASSLPLLLPLSILFVEPGGFVVSFGIINNINSVMFPTSRVI